MSNDDSVTIPWVVKEWTGPTRGPVNLLDLNGSAWLRLWTVEGYLPAMLGWCRSCRNGIWKGSSCNWCGGEVLPINEAFWKQVERKITNAIRADPSLLPEVKHQWRKLYGEQRTPPLLEVLPRLQWVWEHAGNPPHHPFDHKLRYQIAQAVQLLCRYGLSLEEIVDVMDEHEFPDGPFKRGKKTYGNLPGQELRRLKEEVRQAIGFIPAAMRDPVKLKRTWAWVTRQREVPMARLRGEVIRPREAKQEDQKESDG